MESQEKPKFGAGHVNAFFRQGLEELRNTVYPESNVVEQHTPYGIYGSVTPGEVSAERKADTMTKSEERVSVLDQKLREIEASREDVGRIEPDRDRNREIER